MENKMAINLAEDIRSVTDLKRKTREILDQIHKTKRPVVLTVNGRADAVIMDVEVYEKQLKASVKRLAKVTHTAGVNDD
jgi:prevent-host-death family protein